LIDTSQKENHVKAFIIGDIDADGGNDTLALINDNVTGSVSEYTSILCLGNIGNTISSDSGKNGDEFFEDI